MKTLLLLSLFILSGTISNAQTTGSNYTFNNFKKEPIIRYSSANNKMYLLTEQHFNPGVFSLDTLNYDSDLWGNLSTSIVASDFIVADNGDLVFVKDNGSDIELFSTDLNGQLLWSETSTGITPGVITDLKLIEGANSYWMYQESEWWNPSLEIYKFDNNTWSQLLSPDIFEDFEVNSLDQPHILTLYNNTTPGNQGASHKIQFHDGANWQLRYDTTHLNTSMPILGKFCFDSNDTLHIAYSPADGMLIVEYAYLAELHGNTISVLDSVTVSAEQVTVIDILLDLNDNPHITFSTLGLGPWAGIAFYHSCDGNLITSALMGTTLMSDYPNHMARTYSMAVDNDNCMHVAYDFHTDIFLPTDTTHSRVIKYCVFANSQNTISQNGFELISDIALNVNYQWLDCNNNYSPIVGATDSIYDATAGGSFALEVWQNGCTDTSNCITVSGIGIDEYALNSDIQLYPNPTNSSITVESQAHENLVVSVTDLSGKVVLQKKNIESGESIDLKFLKSGIYLITIGSESAKSMQRIVKL